MPETKNYSVTEFLELTPMQKQRLRERDPQQYERLWHLANAQFPDKSVNGMAGDVELK